MDLSLEKLKEAVSIREQIQSLEDRLSSLFGAGRQNSSGRPSFAMPAASSAAAKRDGRRRPMSPATRAKLAAAARARWANARGTGARTLGATTATAASVKRNGRDGAKKGGISAAGRKRLSEAMKARWAARRAGR